MPEKKERIDLPPTYDPEATPVDFTTRSAPGSGQLTSGLKRLAKLKAQANIVKARMDDLTRDLMPMMSKPVALIVNGNRVIASAAQAKPITVDAGALREALWEHYYDHAIVSQLMLAAEEDGADPEVSVDMYKREVADLVDVKMGDVLKPQEVDTKEGGRLERAVEEGKIPLEVFAKVAREKPSSAYIKIDVPAARR